MTPAKMKPETLARRARERAAERLRLRTSLRERLRQAALVHGEDSLYVELLADLEAK